MRIIAPLAVAGAVTLGVAVMLAIAQSGTVGPVPLDADDVAVLFTVGDLEAAGHTKGADIQFETWTKEIDANGDWTLSYEYQPPPDVRPLLFVGSYLFIKADIENTLWAYNEALEGMRIGLGPNVHAVRRDALLNWGDDHECSVLQSSGYDVGTTCVIRRDNLVYMVMISGSVAFTDPGDITDLLHTQIRLLEGYQPAGG